MSRCRQTYCISRRTNVRKPRSKVHVAAGTLSQLHIMSTLPSGGLGGRAIVRPEPAGCHRESHSTRPRIHQACWIATMYAILQNAMAATQIVNTASARGMRTRLTGEEHRTHLQSSGYCFPHPASKRYTAVRHCVSPSRFRCLTVRTVMLPK